MIMLNHATERRLGAYQLKKIHLWHINPKVLTAGGFELMCSVGMGLEVLGVKAKCETAFVVENIDK